MLAIYVLLYMVGLHCTHAFRFPLQQCAFTLHEFILSCCNVCAYNLSRTFFFQDFYFLLNGQVIGGVAKQRMQKDVFVSLSAEHLCIYPVKHVIRPNRNHKIQCQYPDNSATQSISPPQLPLRCLGGSKKESAVDDTCQDGAGPQCSSKE